MPGIWYQVSLRGWPPRSTGASMAGLPADLHGPERRRRLDLHQRRRCPGPVHRADRRRALPVRRRVASRSPSGEEEIKVKGREQPEVLSSTRHPPRPPGQRGARRRRRGAAGAELGLAARATAHRASSRSSTPARERSWSTPRGHSTPASNLIWADRPGSIGFKLIGRLPLRQGDCPDVPKPGWTGEFEWEGMVPYAELPELTDPDCGYPDHRKQPSGRRLPAPRYQRVHRRLPRAADRAAARRARRARPRRLRRACRPTSPLDSRDGGHPPPRPACGPRHQREMRAIELTAELGRADEPDSVPASVYQAFLMSSPASSPAAAIGDRDLAERWLDRAYNGFIDHDTSTWRWYSHLMELWDEGDEELIGRPWDDLVARRAARRSRRSRGRLRPDPRASGAGARSTSLDFPHAARRRQPAARADLNRSLEVGGGEETVCQVASDPAKPDRAAWAPSWRMVADPVRPERSRWQAFTGQSGQAGAGLLRRRHGALARRRDPGDGRRAALDTLRLR